MSLPDLSLFLLDLICLVAAGILILGLSEQKSLALWLKSLLLACSLVVTIPISIFTLIGDIDIRWATPLLLYATLGGLLVFRRTELLEITTLARNRLNEGWIGWKKSSRLSKWLLGLTGFIFLLAGVTILFSQPAIYDSLTYRLPRLGHWLQNGNLHHFPTIDERQNWMPVVPDLLMLWIISHSREGFWGVQYVQLMGGILAVLSIYSIGHQSGIKSRTIQVAGLLFLCMPNVFLQLMSSQTDLITAGLAMTGLAFLIQSFRDRTFYWQSGAAWALAFGSKGTLYYWALGLPVLFLFLVIHYKPTWNTLLKHAANFGLFFLVLVLPRHVENQLQYGNPLANQELVERHHPDLSINQSLEKTYQNGLSYIIQLFDPQSNPLVLAPLVRSAGEPLTQLLAEDDRYLFDGSNRRSNWESIFTRINPDADGVSTGVVISLFAMISSLLIVFRGKKAAKEMSAALLSSLIISVALFFVFICYKQNGHLYAYRYFILVALPVALLGACLLEFIPRNKLNLVALGMLALPFVHLPYLWASTNQIGLNNIAKTDKNRNLEIYQGTRDLIKAAKDTPTRHIGLDLPYNYPVAGFYRAGFQVEYQEFGDENPTGDSLGSHIIVAQKLEELTGRYHGQCFIYKNESDDFSCALIRPAWGSDNPPPFLYDLEQEITPSGIRSFLSLFRNETEAIALRVSNPTQKAHIVSWKNGDTESSKTIAPSSDVTLEVSIKKSNELMIVLSSYIAEKDHRGFPDTSVKWKLNQVTYPVGKEAPILSEDD